MSAEGQAAQLADAPTLGQLAEAPSLEGLSELVASGPIRRRPRERLLRNALLTADIVAVLFSFWVARELVGFSSAARGGLGVSGQALLLLVAAVTWLSAAKLYGLYDADAKRPNHSTADEIVTLFHLATVGMSVLLATAWATHLADPNLGSVLGLWSLSFISLVTARSFARFYCRRSPSYVQNTVIVGAGDVGQSLARKFLQHPEYGINLVGFIDADPKERREDLDDLTLLGTREELPMLVREHGIERVIIAFSNDGHEDSIRLVRALRDLNVCIDLVPRLYEILPHADHTVEGIPLVSLPAFRLSRSAQIRKRVFDVVTASVSLVLLAPVFLVIALLSKLERQGPVFFKQLRIGAGDRPFYIYKFRTMIADADIRKDEFAHLNKHARNGGDPRMFKIPDDPRVTKLGRTLRRYSLDELPQLVNVLRGEMTLVGPRPLILEEDLHVPEWARRRMELKPGITGLWQVLGNSHISFEEMVRLDYEYVATWSMWRDLQLMMKTLPVVGRRELG
jgi:exopolysaccharide biosynthesis polyprenyl glycosylphosphotransferase